MSEFFLSIGIDPAVIILVLAVFIVILFLIVFRMGMRIRRLERKYKGFMRGKDGQSLERIFAQRFRELERLSETNDIHNQ